MFKKIRTGHYILIVQILLILAISSFAWFSDKSSPTIEKSQMQIAAAEGLVIVFNNDSSERTEVDLTIILSDQDAFLLKQVSSQDGVDFFRIDYGQGLNKQDPTYVNIPYQPSGSINMNTYGMLDFDFFLQTSTLDKYVYLHNDTGFFGTGKDALRFMITFETLNGSTSYMFGETKEDGTTTYPYVTHAVHTAGTFVYGTNPSGLVGDQDVLTYTDMDGGRWASDTDSPDISKMMITLPESTRLSVNIKVWLEGGDPDCIASIGGNTLQGVIKLGSVDVRPAAPNVTAGSGGLITGLTTAMEYYIGTDILNATWTVVSNPNQIFTSTNHVHVRYSEVGATLASYSTEVIIP